MHSLCEMQACILPLTAVACFNLDSSKPGPESRRGEREEQEGVSSRPSLRKRHLVFLAHAGRSHGHRNTLFSARIARYMAGRSLDQLHWGWKGHPISSPSILKLNRGISLSGRDRIKAEITQQSAIAHSHLIVLDKQTRRLT
ncbi:hypothetical protein VTK56DRAFT_7473 [Thermocarpiscus australiensis]